MSSTAAPTGLDVVDRLWCAAFVAGMTLATSRSRRYPCLWLAGVATAASVGSWWLVAGAAALGCSLVGVFVDARNRVLGALIGALASLTLLHLPSTGFHGLPTLIGVVAVVPVLVSGFNHSPNVVRGVAVRVAVVGGGVLVVCTLVFGAVSLLVRSQLDDAIDNANQGLELIRDGDQEGGAAQLEAASRKFGAASRDLGNLWSLPARIVPVVGQHADALATAASAGEDLTTAAATAAETAPYQQLKASGGRIDVATVVAMEQPTARAAAELRTAAARMAEIRSPWLVAPVADALAKFDDKLREALPEAELAEQALAVAPGLLGADGTRNYLVLFTSPSESRNLGGFVGSYGVLTMTEGRVGFAVSGSITDLYRDTGVDPTTINLETDNEFQARYGRYSPARHPQNLTVSPDMGVTAELSRSIFRQVTGTSVDGVVVVDPYAIAALLELTGPVQVEGFDQPLTHENAARYLLFDQYVDYDGNNAERKDRLEDAGRATFEAVTTRDLPGPRRLGQVLGPVVTAKHLLFHPFDPAEQALFEDLGAAGGFEPDPSGDFVSVRTANIQANKIDYFLHRDVDYDATYDPSTGAVQATATVTLRNDAPVSGLPDYIVGSGDGIARGGDPNGPSDQQRGTTRLRVTVYSPLDGRGATVDGAPAGIEHQQELGAQTYSVVVTIAPGATAVVTFDLTGTLDVGRDYQVEVLSQPLVHDDAFTVRVDSGSPAWTVTSGEGLDVGDGIGTRSQTLSGDQRFRATFAPG